MKVYEVMTPTVVTVTPKSSFRNLWKIIFQNRVNALPIVDSKKKLLGIITKEDLLKKLYPDYADLIEDFATASDFDAMEEKLDALTGCRAEDFMNVRAIFTREGTPAMRALSRMIARRVNQLPVLSDEDKVIGMITKGDVFYALFRKHLKTVKSKRSLATI